ncbi:hypothetical protein ACFWUZ_31280 [Streptomyces sp. NPDC058646]|uniref:hypothetical protein n=1 Tax=Streptomyces sp. NPDC058646 TaxID=3346574 RepID=UPI003661CDD2
MRTAARTSLLGVALAGALLAPAAGAAYAAAPQAAAAASVSENHRWSGTPVFIDHGVVAVLRHTSEGPRAKIHAVGRDWEAGDPFAAAPLAVLDDRHRSASVAGLRLALVGGGESRVETLTVTKDGTTRSYPLPKGQGSECRSEQVQLSLGAGVEARAWTSPKGPEVELFTAGTDKAWGTLTRTRPSLTADAGIVVRILNPSSAEPVLEWKVQGGEMPFGHAGFPKMPKSCTPDYPFQKPTQKPVQKPVQKPQPETEPSAKPTVAPSPTPSTTPAATKPQTTGQTSVVPKGGVAAGAETAGEDTRDSTTALAGTGLAAILAGLGAFAVLRGRRAAQR